MTLTGPRPERASAPHPDFTTIRASPKYRLTLPLAGWKCGKPTNPWQPAGRSMMALASGEEAACST
jgi:hypothetical protein